MPAVGAVRNERRDVTVLFADVSGFTAMCEKMDPEEVHSVMNRLFEGLGKAIREEEGHIDKYIGDNVMALFGAPVAHEDDPFRACRAALGMQKFLAEFAVEHARKTGVTLRMRIGLHCGLVLAGGIGSEVKMDYSVLGDTVNLASRLESKAPPGGILISDELARRVRTMFEFGDVQILTVKGKEKPVQAFVLKGLRTTAEGATGLPFVGRAELLERCGAILRRSLEEKPQVLIVSGDLGIGKTRLMEELLRRLEGRARPLFVNVSADLGRRPFGVLRRLVQEFARMDGGFPEEIADAGPFFGFLAGLGEELHSYREALWHLAAPTRLAVPVPDADPIIFRHTLEHGMDLLLERLWKRDAKRVLVLDGFHLVDTASREFFLKSIRRKEGAPLPMLISTRSGVSPDVAGFAGAPCESMVLGPLEATEAENLLDQAVGAMTLPAERRREILDRAAGVPLFIEELVQALRQGDLGELGGDAAPATPGDGTESRLPPMLRAAMMSRLDRLPPNQRGFLCYAAVQGVEFNFVGAARAAGLHETGQVETMKRALREADVIRESGAGLWHFRQPLLREACYDALLKRDRRDFHVQTARELVAMAGSQGIAPETLAYHYRLGEAWQESAESAIRAAERANHLGLPDDAERWFIDARSDAERWLDEVNGRTGQGPERPDHVRTLLFQAVRGLALIRIRRGEYPSAREDAERLMKIGDSGQGILTAEAERITALIESATGHSTEAETLLKRGLDRISGVIGSGETTAALVGDLHGDYAELLFRGGRFDEARDAVARWRGVLAADDLRGRIRADTLEGRILYSQGSFVEALERFRQARAGAERIGALSERARAENYLGNAARDLGRHDEARSHFAEALSICEKTQDAEGIAGAHNNLGNLAMSVGHWPEAEGHHQKAFQRWNGMGNVPGAAMAQANLAILAIEQGRVAEAAGLADESLKRAEACGHSVLKALVTIVQGEVALTAGDLDRASERFDTILSGTSGSPFPLARFGALRGKGRVALARGEFPEAMSRLDEARQGFVALKRAQEAARTALWVAEALAGTGKHDEALTMVGEAQQQLVEIGACGDVVRAQTLRARLLENADKNRGGDAKTTSGACSAPMLPRKSRPRKKSG